MKRAVQRRGKEGAAYEAAMARARGSGSDDGAGRAATTEARTVSIRALTQVVVLSTEKGRFFTVHLGGFPVDKDFYAGNKRNAKRALEEAIRKAKLHSRTRAELEAEGAILAAVTAEGGHLGKSDGRSSDTGLSGGVGGGGGGLLEERNKGHKVRTDLWEQGGSVLQEIGLQKERVLQGRKVLKRRNFRTGRPTAPTSWTEAPRLCGASSWALSLAQPGTGSLPSSSSC